MTRHLKALVLGTALTAFPALAAPPDGLITSKTKLSLLTAVGVKSSAVHVDTNDGVVTLYGKVTTEGQKAVAEKTARDIVGVRAVKNLLQIVSDFDEKRVAQSDLDISAAATKQLKADPSLKDSSITIKSVDKGAVLLSGTARTLSDHLRAVEIVDRLPGVRRVSSEVKSPDTFGTEERITFLNPIATKPAASPKPEGHSSAADMRMTASVKLRLFTAAQVPSAEISVDTDDGVVTLFGMVPTADVKKSAAEEAGKVSGVTRVLNQLEVVATSHKKAVEAKDSDISRDLALAFKDRPEFRKVETAVKNGTVRLTGTVASGWDEVNVARLVRQIAGVKGVEDQLKIDEATETTRRD